MARGDLPTWSAVQGAEEEVGSAESRLQLIAVGRGSDTPHLEAGAQLTPAHLCSCACALTSHPGTAVTESRRKVVNSQNDQLEN